MALRASLRCIQRIQNHSRKIAVSQFSSVSTRDCSESGKTPFSIVTPSNVSARRTVPLAVVRPPYSETGRPAAPLREPEVKNEEAIKSMRRSCQLAMQVLCETERHIQVGVTTDDLDALAHDKIVKAGAYPSPLNYLQFPKSICTSVNNVACHGIPDDRPLQDGDIINVDITVYLDGFHGDCSKTFLVGNVDPAGRRLVEATRLCLEAAIDICRPGQRFSAIGSVINKTARRYGYQVIPAFIGHGIGSCFHCPPDILHIPNRYPGKMEPGNTFTIEPILSEGGGEIEILEDGWTAVTTDQSRSAQFEHTVLITPVGVEILTRAPTGQ